MSKSWNFKAPKWEIKNKSVAVKSRNKGQFKHEALRMAQRTGERLEGFFEERG